MHSLDIILCDFLYREKDNLVSYLEPGQTVSIDLEMYLPNGLPVGDTKSPQYISDCHIDCDYGVEPLSFIDGSHSFRIGRTDCRAGMTAKISKDILASCCLVAKTNPCTIQYAMTEYRLHYTYI